MGAATGWTGLRAALAALLTAMLASSHAGGQETSVAASPELADQKAMMLKGFFSSKRLSAARETNPRGVGPLEAEARANLKAGHEALAAGQVSKAIELFDAGMRKVSEAVALGSAGAKWDKQAESIAFVRRRRQAESYMAVIEAAEDLAPDERKRAVNLRGQIDEADREFTGGTLRKARDTLEAAYGGITGLVSDIQRGHTVVVSRIFETPRDEYDYEAERHRSYVLLVQITLAERGEDQPGLAAMAAKLSAESERLRERAEAEGKGGDYVTAIDTLESATERLLAILRATGAIVME